jgi:hypothetical protein
MQTPGSKWEHRVQTEGRQASRTAAINPEQIIEIVE